MGWRRPFFFFLFFSLFFDARGQVVSLRGMEGWSFLCGWGYEVDMFFVIDVTIGLDMGIKSRGQS